MFSFVLWFAFVFFSCKISLVFICSPAAVSAFLSLWPPTTFWHMPLEYFLYFVLMVNFKASVGETLYHVEHKQRGPPGREETMHAFKGIPSPGLFNTDLLRSYVELPCHCFPFHECQVCKIYRSSLDAGATKWKQWVLRRFGLGTLEVLECEREASLIYSVFSGKMAKSFVRSVPLFLDLPSVAHFLLFPRDAQPRHVLLFWYVFWNVLKTDVSLRRMFV